MNHTPPSPDMEEGPTTSLVSPSRNRHQGGTPVQLPQAQTVLLKEPHVVPFRPRLKNAGTVARHLAMAERLIADPTTDDHRRTMLIEKADNYRRQLRQHNRCTICGKPLSDPTSIERGIGSDCWAKRQAS